MRGAPHSVCLCVDGPRTCACVARMPACRSMRCASRPRSPPALCHEMLQWHLRRREHCMCFAPHPHPMVFLLMLQYTIE